MREMKQKLNRSNTGIYYLLSWNKVKGLTSQRFPRQP